MNIRNLSIRVENSENIRQDNQSNLLRNDEIKLANGFGASSRKRQKKTIETGNFKNGAEPSSFYQKSKLFGIHPVKQNKYDGHNSASA